MKRLNSAILPLTVILAIALAICVLGILQYRWTNEIAVSEQQRLAAVLKKDVREFNRRFAYDFERLGEAFELDPAEPASTIDGRMLARYVEWKQSTTEPDVLAGIYLWRKDAAPPAPDLESLDRTHLQFQTSNWASELEQLPPDLQKQFARLPSSMAGREALYYPWKFYGDGDALVRPLFRLVSPARDSDMEVEPIGLLIVEIDEHYLDTHYFPELVEDLSSSGFKTVIRSARPPYRTIYLSGVSFPISSSPPDAQLDLFDSVVQEAQRRGHPAVDFVGDGQQWQLVVRHSSGSLEAAVTEWRRTNLAISLGLLLILLICLGLVFSTARRAERLGKFQLQFVAGVSHELSTPLTVINSALENVADGIAGDPAKAREYALILRDQSSRLSRLLDQVLLLASGKLGQSSLDLQPVEIASVVALTIAASEQVLREKQFAVEKEIAADVPSVVADPVLVSECVENLINNAVKYAGPNRWIAVRVRHARTHSLDEIQVAIEDRGIGIASPELGSIFEPFHRVQAVRDGPTRGAGLGLYLVKRMVENMGGQVSVSSELGRGSSFVLHFPVKRSGKEMAAPVNTSASPAK